MEFYMNTIVFFSPLYLEVVSKCMHLQSNMKRKKSPKNGPSVIIYSSPTLMGSWGKFCSPQNILSFTALPSTR